MLVEMQLKSEPIRRMVRNAVKAARICTTASQASYYLDHISVGQPTLRASDHTAPLAGTSGFQTQTLEIHQPADALLVQLSDLQSAPDFAPVSTLTPASVDIVVSVTLSIHQSGSKKGQPRFSVALVTVNGTNALGSLLAPNLQGQVQFNQTADLDLSALTSLTQTGAKPIANCGVAASADGSRMSLLFDMGDAAMSQNEWTAFMAGGVTDRLGALDWSVFVDAQSMNDALASQILNAVKTQFDQINSGPTATWEPNGATVGHAEQHGEVNAEIFDACTGLFGPCDLSIELDLDLTISVPEPNLIRVDAAVDWHGNKWTEFWCSFSEIVAGPALFALFPDQGHSWVGGVMAFNPLGPIGNLALVIWAFNSDVVTGLALSSVGGGFTKIDDTHFRSETVFSPPSGLPITGMRLTSVNGGTDGIVIGGAFDPVVELNDPVLSIKPWSDTGFNWVNPDPCNLSAPQLQAQILFDESPYYLFMCPPVFLPGDDPANQYSTSIAEWDQNGVTFVLNTINPGFAPGYDCKVLLLTTGGARYIRITKPAALTPFATPQDQLNYEISLIGYRATNCYKTSSIWNVIGMFNPQWSVDPEVTVASPAEQIEHGWSFAIAGLNAGENVTLVDGAGVTLATATAGEQGAVTLDALTRPAGGAIELSVLRGGKPLPVSEYNQRLTTLLNGPALVDKGTFAHRQMLLSQVGSVKFPAALSNLSIVTVARDPQLVTVANSVFRRHDLRVLKEPRLLEERAIPGLVGVVEFLGRLIGFGPLGIADLGSKDRSSLWRAPVVDVSVQGDRLLVLDGKTLTILDRDFAVVTRSPVAGGKALAASGRFILVGLGGSVIAYERRRGDRFDQFGSAALDASGGVSPGEAFGSRGAFYVQGEGASVLLSLDAKGNLRQAARYKGRSWFPGSHPSGTLLARRDPTGTVAEILRVGNSRVYGGCDGGCKSDDCCGQVNRGKLRLH